MIKISHIFSVFFFALLLSFSCTNAQKEPEPAANGENEPETPAAPAEKEIMLWFDASANFHTFSDKANVVKYLDKARETGFNKIVLDVRPLTGYPMYPSRILPVIGKLHGTTIHRDWDYLQYFLEEAHRRNMKVTASMTVFSGGQYALREGLVYDDAKWNGKSCVEYMPNKGMMDIRNDPSQVAVFMNPIDPDVQALALSLALEIAANYPVDGLALDYCRYADDRSDFSELSRTAFERYIGKKLTRFPDDIFKWDAAGNRVAGMYYKQWWEFRAMNIYGFIKRMREEVKAVRPDIAIEYWAASWYGALYTKGQNWASQRYETCRDYPAYATENYSKAGFAAELDIFQSGAYMEKIWGADDPESMEAQLANSRRVIKNDCKVYGSFYAANQTTNEEVSDAVFLCLDRMDGVMVFDIVQVIHYNTWEGVRDGIRRAGENGKLRMENGK
ncbi:MAG: family 10 glycosylhydrolase [Bacteroidales bacterium]|jgi:uncharacterized lipoprotein YddW (UPF0748 family)|nr:family 10 glycosylhydrolase [Bacteroidales bacterium]